MNNVIESMKAKGFTYLGIVEGERSFVIQSLRTVLRIA